jgi:hypothetical protein
MAGNDPQQGGMFSYSSPEQLLRALLLQMLYSARSERVLVEKNLVAQPKFSVAC